MAVTDMTQKVFSMKLVVVVPIQTCQNGKGYFLGGGCVVGRWVMRPFCVVIGSLAQQGQSPGIFRGSSDG